MKFRLYQVSPSFKWAITAFVLLTSLGMLVAALISHNRYSFDHQKTVYYYQGDPTEGEMVFPKLYSQLIQTTHVHSFTMPMVFFGLWLLLQATPLRSSLKKLIIFGGSLSILIYNAAPYLLRYYSPHAVFLFTVGGLGLFGFFFWPATVILYETWFGFKGEIS